MIKNFSFDFHLLLSCDLSTFAVILNSFWKSVSLSSGDDDADKLCDELSFDDEEFRGDEDDDFLEDEDFREGDDDDECAEFDECDEFDESPEESAEFRCIFVSRRCRFLYFRRRLDLAFFLAFSLAFFSAFFRAFFLAFFRAVAFLPRDLLRDLDLP